MRSYQSQHICSISETTSSVVVVMWSKRFLSMCMYSLQFPPRCKDTRTHTHHDGIVLTTRMEAEWLVRSSKHCDTLYVSPFF